METHPVGHDSLLDGLQILFFIFSKRERVPMSSLTHSWTTFIITLKAGQYKYIALDLLTIHRLDSNEVNVTLFK